MTTCLSALQEPERERAAAARIIMHLRTIKGRGGGPEKTLLASSRHIGDDYDLRLVYIRPMADDQYDMPARAARAGANLVDIPERNGWDPRTVARLAREIRGSRPALLHAHDHKTNVLAFALGRMFRLPVVTTMHGNVTRGGRLELYYRLERPALRRMDRVVAVSPDLVDYALEIGLPRERVRLVENAIDLEQFTRRTSVEEAKRRLGLSPDRLLIGAVGRLSEEKGFDRLIEAFRKGVRTILPERPEGCCAQKRSDPFSETDLVIVGEGPQRAALEGLIAQRGLEGRVRLVGYQADTVGWFEAMDLFVLSSLREGLPNVVLEAMALEVPVVATRIAGVPRLVADGENGLLVEPNDVDGLCRAIGHLINEPDLRARFASAARKTIERGYSFEQRMAKIRAIYDEVLGERDASASR